MYTSSIVFDVQSEVQLAITVISAFYQETRTLVDTSIMAGIRYVPDGCIQWHSLKREVN